MRVLSIFVLALLFADSKIQQPKDTLIYFGFDKHNETPEDVLRLARLWGSPPICAKWRPTLKREDADYQVLFDSSDVTLIDSSGRVLYTGGAVPLYLPHAEPDGRGVNICELTGE